MCNPCRAHQELFEGACYPTCHSFYGGRWPIRVGPDICCMQEPCSQFYLRTDPIFGGPERMIRQFPAKPYVARQSAVGESGVAESVTSSHSIHREIEGPPAKPPMMSANPLSSDPIPFAG